MSCNCNHKTDLNKILELAENYSKIQEVKTVVYQTTEGTYDFYEIDSQRNNVLKIIKIYG